MNANRERALALRGIQALARFEAQEGDVIAPAVSIYETPEAFLVAADMPGADKESVQVRTEAGALTISANVVRSQVQNRAYARHFVLTDGIDYGKAEAEFVDGVLTVRLPKKSEALRRDIPVRGE
jgi:HSP20 family protein